MDIFSAENSSFSSSTASPRLSFSHNLDNSLIETYPYRSDSSSDFNFCFTGDPIETEASSADELFSNGLIRPNYTEDKSLPAVNSSPEEMVVTTEKSFRSIEGCDGNQSKSFWRIKRSSSLHCENTKLKSSFWSSLPLLSRSNSTGSDTKERQNKQNPAQKQNNKNSSMAVSDNYCYSSMKPPLKRNYGGAYDYGVRISPVLNVPPPFISKNAANLLGLGSFFGHGNDIKNKK